MERYIKDSKLVFELDSVSIEFGRTLTLATIHGSVATTEVLMACNEKGQFDYSGLKGKVNTIHYLHKKEVASPEEKMFCSFEEYQKMGKPSEIERKSTYKVKILHYNIQ